MRVIAVLFLSGLLAGCGGERTPEDKTPSVETPDPMLPQLVPFPTAPNACEVLSLPALAFDATGPYGILRHDRAEDFSVPLTNGGSWTLSSRFSGCESYLFVPSGRSVSALDTSSIWNNDVDALIDASPLNAHYFFVATRAVDDAPAEIAGMQERIDDALALLDADTATWWRDRLHVVADHRDALGNWVGSALTGQGAGGFAIDRDQRVRLLGSFADVDRFSATLQNAGEWPWEANLAYASYEARHYNYEALRAATLAAEIDVTLVTPWVDEVLAGEVDKDVMFPSAAEMATLDTFEIDLTMDCADPSLGEFGNCGAWDYLSHLRLLDDDGVTWHELGRFITTYHREGHYLVDATPMLAQLKQGGMRTLRYVLSPPWNMQAYLTRMDLRFSNRGRGASPSDATFLFAGGNFNTSYNDAYQPIDVPIAASAKKVELWAIITGHGAETFNCAEFCNHQHAFTVNGATYEKTHALAATNDGCIDEVDSGMVPNQGGTWWFGRGGWCPGQQVEPYVVDVTQDVTPGQNATVSYQGLLNGNPPPDSAGNIVMESWLVVYE